MRHSFKLALAGVLFSTTAFAAVTPTPAMLQTPNVAVQNFVQGTDSAGTYKTVFTAGSNGSVVRGMMVTSTDSTTTHLVTCAVVRSATNYIFTAFTAPLGAGTTITNPAVAPLTATITPGLQLDADGNPTLYLKSGDTLACTYATTLTSTTQINVVAIGADF